MKQVVQEFEELQEFRSLRHTALGPFISDQKNRFLLQFCGASQPELLNS